MNVEDFCNIVKADFYTGVPDSQLKELCNYLMNCYGISEKHIIAANEGNAVGLAAGYHLATRKIPVVYLQNSGIGNSINPMASLLHDKVYAIPCIFIVGYRGEPETKDEPQHMFQGEVTLKLLEDMQIPAFVIRKETSKKELEDKMEELQTELDAGKSIAFVIGKGAFQYGEHLVYKNKNRMEREEIIRHIVDKSGGDIMVSTTGKASRELFEIREEKGQSHKYDFLTVGSMGHSSSIALSIALQKKKTRVFCIDGDGSVLMHMGAMAVIANQQPENMVHIIINNGAHETVGGMPTAAANISMVPIAKGCGYPYAVCADTYEELDEELEKAKNRKALSLIEVTCSIGARENLGRPTTTAKENKESFMEYLEVSESR